MHRSSLIAAVAAVCVSACGVGEQADELALGQVQQRLALFEYSASNTATTTSSNSATFPLDIASNETVMIGTCGLTDAIPDPSGGNVIRLKNLSGTEVTSWGVYNPGAGCTSFTRTSYTATTAGTYTIWAGCASSSSCSGTVGISRRKGQVTFSATNTNGALQNTYNKQYFFNGGETIRVGTCANSSFGASVTSGDTYLRLFKQVNGVYSQVAVSDNAPGCGTDSEIVYTIPTAGYYQVRAGCVSNSSCAGTFTVYSE
jgi:hypothetical protein